MEGIARPDELPPVTIVLLEDIAERFQAAEGHWRLELEFVDGSFQQAWRHHQVQPRRLREFDVAAGAAGAVD
jgi:hypothetical protein